MITKFTNTLGISVIIIFHKRHSHLLNTLKGLDNGSLLPEEVILVEMDFEPIALPELKMEIKHFLFTDFELNNLPLAAARNKGAALAKFETLVFLDVDCIPSKDFVMNIKNDKPKTEALYMGLPLYLKNPVNHVETFGFAKEALHHPNRPKHNVTVQTGDYGLFWSLCFYITATLYFEIGGFDEHYQGYGAEDTDFGFKCRALDIPFYLTTYKVYHQPHPFYRPPLNHIKSIINNCNQFYNKWRTWPMENHLLKFSEMGHIIWKQGQTSEITLIRAPDEENTQRACVRNEPYS